MSDGRLSPDTYSPGKELPRSDKSGLASNRRIEALGIPALLGNRESILDIEQGRPGKSQGVSRRPSEAYRGTSESLGGVARVCGKVSRR